MGNNRNRLRMTPVVKHIPVCLVIFSLSMENEQADDAGRESQGCLARPIFRARTESGGKAYFSYLADHEQD